MGVSSQLRFERRQDALLEVEPDEEPTPRYRTAPAPGKRQPAARVYRYAEADRAPGNGAAEAVARAAVGGGSPLPDELRAMLERALRVPLGGVRIDAGSESAVAAEAIGARAYTIGQDIHFARGTWAPDDPAGLRLIAHEVAHAIQHGSAEPVPAIGELELSRPGDAAEIAADRFVTSSSQAAPPRRWPPHRAVWRARSFTGTRTRRRR